MNFIKFVNTPELNTVKLLNVASGKTDTGAKNTSDSPQTPLGETETTVESQKKIDLRMTKSKADSIAIGADVTSDNETYSSGADIKIAYEEEPDAYTLQVKAEIEAYADDADRHTPDAPNTIVVTNG